MSEQARTQITDMRKHATDRHSERDTVPHLAGEATEHFDQPSSCAPIPLRLQTFEAIDCVCRLTKDLFINKITSFLDDYRPSPDSDYQGFAIHYGPIEYWNIIQPGCEESRVYNRMILSDVYKKLVERGCNAEGSEIRFTELKR